MRTGPAVPRGSTRHALAGLPWPDAGERAVDAVLPVPLGATEQHLAPGLVRMDSAVPGDNRPLAQVWPLPRAGGVRAVSESGILGDPAGATAGEGRTLLDRLSAALVHQVAAWHPGVPG